MREIQQILSVPAHKSCKGLCNLCGETTMTVTIKKSNKWLRHKITYSITCDTCHSIKHMADYKSIERLIPWLDSLLVNDPWGNHYVPPTNIEDFLNTFTNPYYHEPSGNIVEFSHLQGFLKRWRHVKCKQEDAKWD